jgi:integrase/recombinase XerD
MLDQLFHYLGVLARHREAPMVIEREQYLQHCADQGMAQTTVIQRANALLVIVQRLDLAGGRLITQQQIEGAADRWARYQRRRGRCHGLRWPRERFVQVASDWMRFLGRLQVCEPEPSDGALWIAQFAAYMQEERDEALPVGPHALRHACAGHLVAQGFSLKKIGDHLGHRSASATRTYAKVDLAGLREVADFSLGGLL